MDCQFKGYSFVTLQGGGALGPLSSLDLCKTYMFSTFAWGFCLCVCLLNFSICLSISPSVYLRLPTCTCMSACLPACLSVYLSVGLSVSLAQHMWCSSNRPGITSLILGISCLLLGLLNQSRSRLAFNNWWKPIILNYASFIRNHYHSYK